MNRTFELRIHIVKYFALFLNAFIFSKPYSAAAQRGLQLPRTDLPESPSSGIPGFFDTMTANPQSLTFDFPTLNLDYGLTPDLTIGTNILTVISVAESISNGNKLGLLFLNGKIRYRLFSFDGFSAALTGYLLGAKISSTENADALDYIPAATLNGAYSYADGSLGFSLSLASLNEIKGRKDSINYEKSSTHGSLYTVWWRKTPIQTMETELLLSACPPIYSTELTNIARVDTQSACFGEKYINPLMRGTLSWRSSSEWLWSAGLIWLPYSSNLKIPFIGVNYITRLFAQDSNGG